MNRFWTKVDKGRANDCWEWQGSVSSSGYGSFKVGGQTVSAHRLAWELGNDEEIPDGMCVCHSCDNPLCCNPAHLWLGTVAENNQDKISKGRHNNPTGEDVNTAKLTKAQVRTIRSDPRTQMQIAKDYGVNQTTISKIKRGEAWCNTLQ